MVIVNLVLRFNNESTIKIDNLKESGFFCPTRLGEVTLKLLGLR